MILKTSDMIRQLTGFLLLLLSNTCFSQSPETYPSIDGNDLPGAKFKPARTFNGESLFGYIDGGAELYLEYGFSSVWVTEIEYLKGKYKTEIYKMKGPEEAFGIFSISRFRCLSTPPVSKYSCQTRYQLQICSGQFYISIINSTGTETDSIASVRIAEAIVRKVKGTSADISYYLPGISPEFFINNALLVKGRLGLMNGASDWEDYFMGISGFNMVILPGEEKTILSVRFTEGSGIQKFAALHGWETRRFSEVARKVSESESVRQLSDNHLIIEVSR